MYESYCGKSCAECPQKEALNCPGCLEGPGKECEIALCCKNKGHESCGTCTLKDSCDKLQGCAQQPETRQKQKERVAEYAPLLGKWLWILFWVVIVVNIFSLADNSHVLISNPNLYMFAQIVSVIGNVACALILLKLSPVDNRYHTAGICGLIAQGLSLLLTVVSGTGVSSSWSLLITLPAAALNLYALYNECSAHSSLLKGIDNELSLKWSKIWKWRIYTLLGLIASTVLLVIAPGLGLICVVVAVIALLIVYVLQIIYIYKTANIFREYHTD